MVRLKTEFDTKPTTPLQKKLRQLLKLTGSARMLAAHLGVSRTSLWRWVHGKGKPGVITKSRIFSRMPALAELENPEIRNMFQTSPENKYCK